MPENLCGACGCSFHARPCDLSRGWGNFCSKACWGIAQREARIAEARERVSTPFGLDGQMVCRVQVGENGADALINAEDAEKVRDIRWRVHPQGYAVGSDTPDQRCALMHRVILGASVGALVDHRNGNRLDNRRSNIRLATPSQNGQNRHVITSSTGYRNVYRHPCSEGRFTVAMQIRGKKLHLGCFDTAEAAHEFATRKRRELMTHSAECP
jgi:hypothetical protein